MTKACVPSLRGTSSGPGEEAAASGGVGRVRKCEISNFTFRNVKLGPVT